MTALFVAFCFVRSAVTSSATDWLDLGRSRGDETLRLSFALKRRNLEKLERTFWAVSDPRNVEYGKFLSFEEIKAMIAPEPELFHQVLAFFDEQGIRAKVNPGGDYVDADFSARQASAIFQADIHAYQSQNTQRVYHRALNGFRLPEALVGRVEHVFPLRTLPRTTRPRGRSIVTVADATADNSSGWPRDCQGLTKDGMITPQVLRARYNISLPDSPRKGSIATILPYDPDDCGFIQDDLKDRNKLCGMQAPVLVDVRGSKKSKFCPERCKKKVGDYCGESNLDVHVATGVADGVAAQYWIGDGQPLSLMKEFMEDANSSLVLSCSFGDFEDSYEDDGGKVLDEELQKAGVMGKTIIFASGDTGVWKPKDLQSQSNKPAKFDVGYPASSPYVTAVGGSQFIPRSGGDRGGDVIGAEMGVMTGLNMGDTWITHGSSGGGISNLFKVPSYQSAAMSAWYDEANATGTLPNVAQWAHTKNNRGYPDVAILAGLPGEGGPGKKGTCTGECANYYLRQNGYWTHEDGTSAASPAFAGMVAVLNEHRLAAGKPSMGFINPFLYQNPTAFDDITEGDNKYYKEDKGGYLAAKGWDPVTGLGSPNVARLVDRALAAAQSVVTV